jgi:hypothetical protein
MQEFAVCQAAAKEGRESSVNRPPHRLYFSHMSAGDIAEQLLLLRGKHQP